MKGKEIENMKNKRAAELFLKYLKLSTFPVALKMCTGKDELPVGTKIPRKKWGVDFRACQAVHVARRDEFTVAVSRDDMPCPTGSVALGFFKPTDLYWSGLCFSPPYQSQEAKKKRAKTKNMCVPKSPIQVSGVRSREKGFSVQCSGFRKYKP